MEGGGNNRLIIGLNSASISSTFRAYFDGFENIVRVPNGSPAIGLRGWMISVRFPRRFAPRN